MYTPSSSGKDAAFEITAGSWYPLLSWLFCLFPMGVGFVIATALWKYYVLVEGVEHRLTFATPVRIPVMAGYHEVEFCVAGLLGPRVGKRKYTVSVAPGTVQPVLYRIGHFPFGLLIAVYYSGLVVKPGAPRLDLSQPLNTTPQYGAGGYGGDPFAHGHPSASHLGAPHTVRQPLHATQPPNMPNGGRIHFDDTPPRTKPVGASGGSKMRYCPGCGVKIEFASRFCASCGHQLGA